MLHSHSFATITRNADESGKMKKKKKKKKEKIDEDDNEENDDNNNNGKVTSPWKKFCTLLKIHAKVFADDDNGK